MNEGIVEHLADELNTVIDLVRPSPEAKPRGDEVACHTGRGEKRRQAPFLPKWIVGILDTWSEFLRFAAPHTYPLGFSRESLDPPRKAAIDFEGFEEKEGRND
jgi:hypothetical protein